MNHKLLALALASSLSALACGGSEEAKAPEIDCAKAGTVPTYSSLKTTSLVKCLICHDSTKSGPARVDAPLDVNYDMYEMAKAKAKQGAAELNEGAMPPTGYGMLTDAEKQAFYTWALCGTPQ